jgi:hypothetical protein
MPITRDWDKIIENNFPPICEDWSKIIYPKCAAFFILFLHYITDHLAVK